MRDIWMRFVQRDVLDAHISLGWKSDTKEKEIATFWKQRSINSVIKTLQTPDSDIFIQHSIDKYCHLSPLRVLSVYYYIKHSFKFSIVYCLSIVILDTRPSNISSLKRRNRRRNCRWFSARNWAINVWSWWCRDSSWWI